MHQLTRQQVEWVINRPGGSVLLHGHQHGKIAVAQEIARRLNCTGCSDGSCASCRLVEAGNHPDILFVQPNDKGKIIIEQIHELHHQLTYNQYSAGAHRVVIIENAHLMTLPAENAFLKTLEEPPVDTTIILTAISPSSLLATTVSRCRLVYVAPVANQLAIVNPELEDLTERLLSTDNLLVRLAAAGEAAKLGGEYFEQITAKVRRQARSNSANALNLSAVQRLKQRIDANVAAKTAYEAFALELKC